MLARLSEDERGLLLHRWQTLEALRARAPWAGACLSEGPVGRALASAEASSGAAGRWDQVGSVARRTALGQVFTPPELAAALAELIPGTPESVLDPACGDGSLLVAMADLLHARGVAASEVLGRLVGWDRDPCAAWLARARLVEWADAHGVTTAPVIEVRDALAVSEERFAAVIANPPYLEAKRMRGAEPGLRERLRRRFPGLSGAWDLYCAFLHRAEELVAPGGHAAFLVPSKVLQARYAASLRRAWLAEGPLRLTRVVDCATLKPPPFPGTSVYPALLGFVAGLAEEVVARRAVDPAELRRSTEHRVPHEVLRRAGDEVPVFVPFASWPLLEPLLALPRLGEVARVASTCSFHVRGLREQYVGRERPASQGWRYLGGQSRARRNEVGCYAIDWRGYWIRFDNDELRAEHGNPLPSLATFTRPKLVFCQHARRLEAALDEQGQYVTKDVFPVAWPTDDRWSLAALCALFNSTVVTALYNTLYQGVRVQGETYHYLPAFLREVPVPPREHPALADLDALATAISGPEDPRWHQADLAITRAYGLDGGALAVLRDLHLRRVGAPCPRERHG